MRNKADDTEKQKRVYRISLLLRRKPSKFLVEYMRQKWGIKRRQSFNYIKLAKKEWADYYAKYFGVPFQAYYLAELRDLTDEALKQNDLRLAFNIAKEEAKIMGAYLPEKSRQKKKNYIKIY
jgi:hypothetical protein